MSDVRDLLVATAHEVFGRPRTEIEAAIKASGLDTIRETGDLGDISAVIRVSAYHGVDDGFGDAAMPPMGDEHRRGALLRAIQITGALERVSHLTVAYARERRQFGRPLNQFQAVQHQVADIAGNATIAAAAVDRAIEDASHINVAVAKVVAGDAAGRVAAAAHQIHGAIGFTQEYELHRHTANLWRWRDEFGTETWWAGQLGDVTASLDRQPVWRWVTDG